MARLLVIEDNPLNRKLIVVMLKKAAHTVLEADDAETGLALVRSEMPELVLMDVQLPRMSGFEAIRLLKRDAATAAIPVIAVTAMAMKGDAERILAAGFDDCIIKPLRYTELWEAIARLLPNNNEI